MKGTKISYIYCLKSSLDDTPRYIGMSLDPLKSRIIKHLHGAKKPLTHKECWINGVIKAGGEILIEILQCSHKNDISFWEQHYISLYKSWGFNLTNLTRGGDGASTLSEESKKKISKSLTGKKHSVETIEKRRAAVKKTWESEELREAQKLRFRGKSYEEIHGIERAKELKEKISASHKGKPYNISPESNELRKEKIRNSCNTPEYREKVSKRLLGKSKKDLPELEILRLFKEEGKTTSQIASIYNVDSRAIVSRLKRYIYGNLKTYRNNIILKNNKI